MNRTPDQWALVNPRAVVSGSSAQAENVLTMALADIATLSDLLPWPDSRKISFIECHVGHGRLTAKNWIDSGCPWCRVRALEAELAATRKVAGIRLVRAIEGEIGG